MRHRSGPRSRYSVEKESPVLRLQLEEQRDRIVRRREDQAGLERQRLERPKIAA